MNNHNAEDSQRHSRPRRAPEGHECPLAAMIKNRTHAKITLLSGAEETGVLTAFDKFTVSLLPDDASFPVTYFKHGILSFTRVL